MNQSILVGTAGLGALAVVALILTLARRPVGRGPTQSRSDLWIVFAAVLLQAAHFAEELTAGFYVRFPQSLGLEVWPAGFFVAFNLAWLALWCASAAALRTRRRVALFPIWFLSLASMANGLAHPVLAARAGGYFPGLLTAPFAAVAGIVLFRRLLVMTAEPGRATIPAS